MLPKPLLTAATLALLTALHGPALVSPALAQQQRPAAPAAAESATAVRRTTLLVEDLQRSIDFYQRLGLTKWYDMSSTEADPGGVIGTDDLPLTSDPKVGRIVIMRGNHDRVGMIGLLAYDKPRLASARGNLAGLGTGDIVIMMEVPDIQEVYRRLNQIDTRFHRTPKPFTVNRPDGTQSKGQRMFAFDPDGHLIEVVEHDK
jgi:catechol 2,3-dioxygenase-like lactoylglutathione lyase family enzyme